MRRKAMAALKSASGEVIVADNGSTDGSVEAAQAEGAKLVNIAQKVTVGLSKAGPCPQRTVRVDGRLRAYDFSHARRFFTEHRPGSDAADDFAMLPPLGCPCSLPVLLIALPDLRVTIPQLRRLLTLFLPSLFSRLALHVFKCHRVDASLVTSRVPPIEDSGIWPHPAITRPLGTHLRKSGVFCWGKSDGVLTHAQTDDTLTAFDKTSLPFCRGLIIGAQWRQTSRAPARP